jgi:hypothetical protein
VRPCDPVVHRRDEHHYGVTAIRPDVVIRRIAGEVRTLDGVVR